MCSISSSTYAETVLQSGMGGSVSVSGVEYSHDAMVSMQEAATTVAAGKSSM